MTKEQLQWAMYEAYATQLLSRIEAQEAEIAKLGTMAEQTRADAVTRAAADEKRIAALRHECERWKAAYSDRCALLDVIHASLGIDKDDNVIGEIDRIHKARNGLQAQVQDLRAALAKEQELHAATALRLSTEAAKLVERKHPVKVGAWVRRTDDECGGIYFGRGVIAQVLDVLDAPEHQYTVSRPEWNGYTVPWAMQYCEPCDPPTEATHDTPEGRSVAESVIRDSRKTEPKPGDTVRLVRIPSRDVVSPELQTVLEWPWIERWGTLNQTAMVVETAYHLEGAVAVCLSANVHARWPINCLEVVTEATHDTEAGKAVTAVALADVRKVTT